MKHQESVPLALADAPEENPNPVMLINREGMLIYANTASTPLLEAWKINIGDRMPDDFLRSVFSFATEGTKGSFEISCGERYYAFRVSLAKGQDHIHLYGNDITEDKITREKLRTSEKQFRQLADGIPQFIWTAQPNGAIDYINERGREFEGVGKQIDRPIDWSAVIHPDDIQETLLAWNRALESGNIFEIEHRLQKAGGQWRWHLGRAIPLRDECDRIIKWLGSTTDIDDIKRAEEALQKNEERLRLAMEGGYLGAVEHDLSSGYVMGDDLAQSISGIFADKIEFDKAVQIFHPEDAERLKQAIKDACDPAIAKSINLELRIVERGGSMRWIAIIGKSYFAGEGSSRRAVRIMATLMDITERKRAEEALRESQERFSAFMSNLPAAAWIKDFEGHYVYANAEAELVFSTLLQELQGKTDEELFPPETALQFRKNDLRVLDENGPLNTTEVLQWADGVEHISIVRKFALYDQDGHPAYVGGVAFDISEQMAAEEALRQSEERLRLALEAGDMGVWSYDVASKIFSNDRVTRSIADILEGGLISDEALQRVHPEDREMACERMKAVLDPTVTKPVDVECRIIRPDGAIRWIAVNGQSYFEGEGPDRHTVRVIGTVKDITERKLVEQALRESEEKFRILAEHAPVVIGIVRGTHFIYVNPFMEKLSGYTPEELLTLDLRQFLHPDSMQLVIDRAIRRQRGEALPTNYEFLMLTKSGEARWIHLSSSAIVYQGAPALVGVGVDITDLKHSEEDLSESRHRLQLATEVAQIGTWHWDFPKNQMTWDANCTKILGAGAGEEISFSYLEALLHPEDRERYHAAIAQSIERREAYQLEFRVIGADGRIRWIFCMGHPFYSENDRPAEMIGVFMDITGRKQREQKLASIAADLERSNKDLEHFAYIASHDLQEPLRTIRGFLQLLEKRYRDNLDDTAREYIDYAVTGAARMHDLIQDLLSYSRVTSAGKPMEATSMEEAFEEVRSSLQLAIDESSACVSHDPLPVVRADPAQMRQLMQNLISNALKFRKPDETPRIHLSVRDRNDMWLFGVQDNGIGIDPKHFDKIFTIFQRLYTSDRYSGTGIGLAVCKRIVERHGGQISLESKPEEGSTFYFTLPKL